MLIRPSRPTLTGALARGDRYWQAPLVEVFETRGVPCLDLSVTLGAVANSDPRAGNAVVAREVQRWIRERGLTPR